MALVKCKECGANISRKAESCPQCGAVKRQKTGCMSYLIGGALILFLLGYLASPPVDDPGSPESNDQSPSASNAQKPPKPVLSLESFECTETDGGTYALIRGRVKNLTDSSLDYVQVVGQFKTGAGEDLGSESTYLDIRPLLPGQVSGFEIYGPSNPKYGRCGVEALLVSSRQVRWESAD